MKQQLKLLLDPSLRNRLFKSTHCNCTRYGWSAWLDYYVKQQLKLLLDPSLRNRLFKSTHRNCTRCDWSSVWLDDHVKQQLKLLLESSWRNRLFKSTHCYCTRSKHFSCGFCVHSGAYSTRVFLHDFCEFPHGCMLFRMPGKYTVFYVMDCSYRTSLVNVLYKIP